MAQRKKRVGAALLLLTITTPVRANQQFQEAASKLAGVDVVFCDNEGNDVAKKHINRLLSPKQTDTICYRIINASDETQKVKITFSDGSYTADSLQKKSCKADSHTQEFGQYITDYESIVTLEPQTSSTHYAQAQFPATAIGLRRGCLAYQILQPKVSSDSQGLFDVIVRKGKFIDYMIDGPLKLAIQVAPVEHKQESRNIIKHDTLYVTKKRGEDPQLELHINNNSDVDQEVLVSLSVVTPWGSQVYARQQKINLIPATAQNALLEIDSLPRYRGLFELQVEVVNQPLGIQDSRILPADTKQAFVRSYTAHMFIFPLRLGLALIIVYLLIHLFVRHRIHCPTAIGHHTQKKPSKTTEKTKKTTTKKRTSRKAA